MSRDRIYSGAAPSTEFVSDEFGDYYSFESRDYIFGKSREAIVNADIINHIQELQKAKNHFGIGTIDQTIPLALHDFDNRYGKKMAYDASSFYVTAKNYLKQAKVAPYDISPVLHYYGFMFFHSSLSNLFYRTVSKKETHGLRIIWPTNIPADNKSLTEKSINDFLNNVAVEILPFGAFARARDFYTINGHYSIFSLLTKTEEIPADKSSTGIIVPSQIILNDNAIVKSSSVKMTLNEIINYKYLNYPTFYELGSSEILFDYIGYFIVSTLARYRPTLWRQISAGIGDLFSEILGMYRRTIDYYCLIHGVMVDKKMLEHVYNRF